jgi:peptidoglycan/xylan/chitin deacetylase (PgdA/CDA1 family)
MKTPLKHRVASLWMAPPDDLVPRLAGCIDASLRRQSAQKSARIFFRADDIGVPGKQFNRLIDLFKRYEAPLSLAVVPAWLTTMRWSALMKICRGTSPLWCWHQHGWRHKNYENLMKKNEYGPSRTTAEIEFELLRGRKRLASRMKERFYPLFTPPWNRCSGETLGLLVKLDYRAVSRYQNAMPAAPRGLPDISVNVDLHTRKETRAEDGWKNLFEELGAALSSGFCGIMIHHQRMNDAAFGFMDILLDHLMQADGCRIIGMPELVQNYERFDFLKK